MADYRQVERRLHLRRTPGLLPVTKKLFSSSFEHSIRGITVTKNKVYDARNSVEESSSFPIHPSFALQSHEATMVLPCAWKPHHFNKRGQVLRLLKRQASTSLPILHQRWYVTLMYSSITLYNVCSTIRLGYDPFYIELDFEGSWTSARRAVFQSAADRWVSISSARMRLPLYLLGAAIGRKTPMNFCRLTNLQRLPLIRCPQRVLHWRGKKTGGSGFFKLIASSLGRRWSAASNIDTVAWYNRSLHVE